MKRNFQIVQFLNKKLIFSPFKFKKIHTKYILFQKNMSSIEHDQISSMSSVDTFAPVAVYRLKYYEPQTLFDNVLYALIRPPRFVYNQRLLIPGRRYQQKFDYQVHNIPFPLSIYWAQNPKYIILYLHGNSSSRFEGYLHLKQLPQGACLACFDFKGCGLRKDGKYITLGKQQSIEVDIAVQYLKTYGYPIVGWGRSMGAVSLLMSSKCDIMIADSPFCSLYDLCKQTSLNFLPSGLCCLVHCLFPCLFCCVSSGVQKKSGMDPRQLEIVKAVQKLCPSKSLLLLAGKQDSMIHYSHAQRLHDAFRGKQKRLILFDGTHNSTRPQQVFDQCFTFIESTLQKRQQKSYRIIKPSQHQSTCKVMRIDRQSSKQSMINNGTVQMSEYRQFESSKETLLMSIKAPIELRPLKITPNKTSPKKLSRIQGNGQINVQGPQIQICHEEQDLIQQGIGMFQKELHKTKHQEKQTFKQISIKNAIEQQTKRQIILKSIKPLNEAKCLQSNGCINKDTINDTESLNSGYNQNAVQIKLLGKEQKPFHKIKCQQTIQCDINTDIENVMAPIKVQISGCKKERTNTCDVNTPSSHPSTLHQQDVKLMEQESFNNLKLEKLNFNTNSTSQTQKMQLLNKNNPVSHESQEVNTHKKTEDCQTLVLTKDNTSSQKV